MTVTVIGFVGVAHLEPLREELEGAVRDGALGLVRGAHGVAPEQRGDAREEDARAERLRDVVVGAELEAERLVDLVVARREEHERHAVTALAQLPAQREAVERRACSRR